jgi:hypothetical protein
MNQLRNGKITSSQVSRLMGAPKPQATYLEELKIARRMNCRISQETSARPTTWGKLVEKRVFDLLPIDYKLTSKDFIQHPQFEYWGGSPDGVSKDCVFDIKCPYTRKSFAQMYEMMEANDIQLFKKEFPEYYWQLVSNAILTGKQVAELIIYLPYLSELEEIRELAANNTDIDLETKLFWIANSIDEDLPHQPNDSGYNNLKIYNFKILQSDIDILTSQIKTLQRFFI